MSAQRIFTICSFICIFLPFSQAQAETECVGEYPYTVCTSVRYDADGDMHMTSHGPEGQIYNMDTDSYTSPEGAQTVRSSDSEGNSYSIHSWSDSTGSHTQDSEGNSCTITNSGVAIGCGE